MPNDRETGFGSDIDVAACRAFLQARQAQRSRDQGRRRQALVRAVHAAARSVLPRFPAVRRAYLFGSVLHPAALRATSDVDIAVEAKLDAQEYFALWRELERAMGDRSVELDLVELDRDLRFAARVRRQGELIYERSD